MEMTLDFVRSHVSSLTEAVEITKLTKGFSSDHKFLVVTEDGKQLLLRTADMSTSARKKDEFETIRMLQEYEIRAPKPIEFGAWDTAQLCYYVVSFVDGEDAADALPGLSESEQFSIGYEAGRDLRKMHQLAAPSTILSWNERCTRKHRDYVEAYKNCGYTLNHADKVLAFIEENLKYIANRPSCFQHDDFHTGNIIVKDGQYAGVIDFNRYDWGDPIHEFLKVGLFSSEVSIPFCNGQLAGYFGQTPIPENFWRIYAMYVGMCMFSSVVWTLRVIPHQMDDMTRRLYRVMEDHKNFESPCPVWYN